MTQKRRYFISQHPIFGSYKNPTDNAVVRGEKIANSITRSPYYYWWLALTLNTQYLNLCANPQAYKSKVSEGMLRVFNDFGDVRYKGNKLKGFCDWFNAKVSDTETKGTYLFAEPHTIDKVELITDAKQASEAVDDASSLLVQIPKGLKRKQIDVAIDRLLATHMDFERGRQVRNPNRSNARYHLTKPIRFENYKLAFDVYEQWYNAEQNGQKISNKQIADAVGLKVKFDEVDEDLRTTKRDRAYENRVYSVAVSRKKSIAVKAIHNVGEGKLA